MAKQIVRFDPSKVLDIQIRVQRDGEAFFRFYDVNGDPISQTGKSYKLFIRRQAGGAAVITLQTTDSSIIITDNELKALMTVELSNISPGRYFYELYDVTLKKTYLTGICYIVNDSFNVSE